MAQWRQPGEPFVITVAGIEITCKPLLRGEAMALAESAASGFEKSADIEALYAKVAAQVIGIAGVEVPGIEAALSYQTHEFMSELFTAILGTGALSDDESKNLPSLSDSLPAERPTGDAPSAEKDTAGTKV